VLGEDTGEDMGEDTGEDADEDKGKMWAHPNEWKVTRACI